MSSASLKRTVSTDRDVSPPPKRRVPPSATAATVNNFFKKSSEKVKAPEKVTFDILHGSVLRCQVSTSQGLQLVDRNEPLKIAAFDFDDTLVTTASGNRFSRDAQDWRWWHASVPDRLQRLHKDGYRIVIISNQGAVKLHADPKTLKGDMKSLNNFKGKVTSVLTRLDLPITLFAATGNDLYRKPRTGMWQLVLDKFGVEATGDINLDKSVFVGDAAGRQADNIKGLKKDHSSSDRDLASNIGIPFKTPEEFFLDEPQRPFVRVFEPSGYLQVKNTPVSFAKINRVDIVLFCGSPGAGKSTFYWTYLQPLGYERANQDILKTRERCLQVASEYLEAGKSIAIDNTNADISTRASWIALARKLYVPIRLVHFTSPAKLCEHNDTVRALAGKTMNPENRKLLPKMAFSGFVARYQKPMLSEGFQDIIDVDFQFYGTDDEREIWQRYWIS